MMCAMLYNSSDVSRTLNYGFQTFDPEFAQRVIDGDPGNLATPSFRRARDYNVGIRMFFFNNSYSAPRHSAH